MTREYGNMVIRELTDAPAPDRACEAFLDLPGVALLDSQGPAHELARYSFLSADPFLSIEAKADHVTIRCGGEWGSDDERRDVRHESVDPFSVLEQELARWSGGAGDGGASGRRRAGRDSPGDSDLPPFRGGLIGFFAYDLLHHLERVPPPRFDDFRLPDLQVGFYDWTIAWDHTRRRAWVISTGLPDEAAERTRRARRRLELVLSRLTSRPLPATRTVAPQASPSPQGTSSSSAAESPPSHAVPEALNLRSTFSRAGYLAAVERAREYILAGDIFQVNLSQRLSLPYQGDAFELYRRLRHANPAPFAAFLDGRDAAVLSASPERFLRLSGDRVETRPIKGTTGRGYTPAHDFALGDDLQASDKDRAENVMIVDLLRNDLSRVAVDGTVRVPHLWTIERHPTVHHLVSTVTARLRPGTSPVDLLRATFPGGSITGAPKVRAMEIIHELEPTRRNVYCGSIGYIGFDGEMDLSIAIRTVILKGSTAYFGVGGAVVADSDPAAEYRETLLKGAGIMRAWTAVDERSSVRAQESRPIAEAPEPR